MCIRDSHWSGSATAVTEQQDALDWLHTRFMDSTGAEKKASAQPVDAKARPLNLDDAALLEKARAARNGTDFDRLWAGDTSGHGGDESAADLALCSLLAFWTGGDAARVDRLFRQSGLFRPKWDSRRGESGTYGQMTIEKAIAGCRDTYSGRAGVRSESAPTYQTGAAGPEERGTLARPVIKITAGMAHAMADEAERYLIEHDPGIFQRGDCLVRWVISKQETVYGIRRPTGTAVIRLIDLDHLLDRMSKIIEWQRWDIRAKEWQATSPPERVAKTLLARSGLWKFPRLTGVITAPTLRPDGSVLDAPGYDPSTGLLFIDQGAAYPPIPDHPTQGQARAALDSITAEVFSGFPFLKSFHKSAALSAALSVCVRHTLRHIPLHAFTAPAAGSGKSLLADAIALIGTGHPSAVLALSDDQTEMNKSITAILLQGDAVVNLDNIERGESLSGREIAKALTQEVYSGRILGASKTANLASSCMWLATGNQLQVSGDMTRRVIPCEIDPECERPDEREFNRDLYEWIPNNRPALVVAALTVLRAYIVAGKPKVGLKPLGGFTDWSGLVRAALIWLGESDPLTGRDAIEDADPDRGKLRALLLAWHGVFGSVETTSKEAIFYANQTMLDDEGTVIRINPDLYAVLSDHFKGRDGGIDTRKLGDYLSQNSNRVYGGMRFEKCGTRQNYVLWKVVTAIPPHNSRESRESRESIPKYARNLAVKTEDCKGQNCAKSLVELATDSRNSPDSPNSHKKTPNILFVDEKFTTLPDSPDSPPPTRTPPPASPLDARVAELTAAGWARSNAEARAKSEALQREKTGDST